jgi:hypothetical protein
MMRRDAALNGDDLADAPAKPACTDNPRKVNGSKSAHEETMMSKDAQGRRVPWNKGRLIRPKPPLKPRHVWGIRIRLRLAPPIAAVKIQRPLFQASDAVPGPSGASPGSCR